MTLCSYLPKICDRTITKMPLYTTSPKPPQLLNNTLLHNSLIQSLPATARTPPYSRHPASTSWFFDWVEPYRIMNQIRLPLFSKMFLASSSTSFGSVPALTYLACMTYITSCTVCTVIMYLYTANIWYIVYIDHHPPFPSPNSIPESISTFEFPATAWPGAFAWQNTLEQGNSDYKFTHEGSWKYVMLVDFFATWSSQRSAMRRKLSSPRVACWAPHVLIRWPRHIKVVTPAAMPAVVSQPPKCSKIKNVSTYSATWYVHQYTRPARWRVENHQNWASRL